MLLLSRLARRQHNMVAFAALPDMLLINVLPVSHCHLRVLGMDMLDDTALVLGASTKRCVHNGIMRFSSCCCICGLLTASIAAKTASSVAQIEQTAVLLTCRFVRGGYDGFTHAG
jgi:hypothetical protein